ncbi:MAG: hypothetical protein V1761_01520 [bacterium]
MKKVLGTMLLTVFLLFTVGCETATTTTIDPSGVKLGTVTIELYDADGIKTAFRVVDFHAGDTLLSLLRAQFVVYCADADFQPDATCGYESQWGYFVLGIDTLTAFDGTGYLALYVNEVYQVVGISDINLQDGAVYAFKYTVS